MSSAILALVNGDTLIGKELRQSLDRRRDLWQELRLLSTDEDQVGALTEVRGSAAMVQRFEPDSLEGASVVFLGGPVAGHRQVLDHVPAEATVILLSPDAGPADGEPIVAGINLHAIADAGDRPLLSPHPGAVALAYILFPLLPFQPTRATVTLLRPASASDAAGLDEVLDQSRGLLGFQTDLPQQIFGGQLAFNLLPTAASVESLGANVRHILAADLPLAVQVVQTGVFHGYGISLFVELLDDPGPEQVRNTLDENPMIELVEDSADLGPVRAAGARRLLLGDVRQAPHYDGGYWLWAAMDNLTVGGATNVIQILEALGRRVIH